MINWTLQITCNCIYRDTPPNISPIFSVPPQFLGVFLIQESHSFTDPRGRRLCKAQKMLNQSLFPILVTVPQLKMESIEHVFNLKCLLRCLMFCQKTQFTKEIWDALQSQENQSAESGYMNFLELGRFVPFYFRSVWHLTVWAHDLVWSWWTLRCFRCRHWKPTDGPAAHWDRVIRVKLSSLHGGQVDAR